MTPHEQLQVITEGRIQEAVHKHLNGDWPRRNELFTISRADFDAWADSIGLPHGRVHDTVHTWDGIYVVQERGRWVAFEQERGCRVHEIGVFDDYQSAKRQALSAEYLWCLTLQPGHANARQLIQALGPPPPAHPLGHHGQ
jgi:hypothetical protein